MRCRLKKRRHLKNEKPGAVLYKCKIIREYIDKYYGGSHVLKDINLTIEDGDFMLLPTSISCLIAKYVFKTDIIKSMS